MIQLLGADVPSFSYSYPFQFDQFLTSLLWIVWVVLNFWIWGKTKALSNILMMAGAAGMALFFMIHSFTYKGPDMWLVLLSTGALTAGFFLSVKPLVEAHLAQIKAKLQHAAAGMKKDGGSTPPPTPPSTPPSA